MSRGKKRRSAAQLSSICTRGVAVDMEERSRLLVNQLLLLSDAAQRAGEGWPDLGATGELRTVLLEVVEAAEAQARRWNDLARRLEALAVEGAHLHLEHGTVVLASEDHLVDPDAAPLPL